MELGTILKDKRLEKAYTQEYVADKLFVSRQTISNWENSKTIPDIESLIDLAQFYNLSLDDILLKGSDVVENIKKNERRLELKKWYIPISITSILSLILMFRMFMNYNIDLKNALLYELAILINIILSNLFFMKEIYESDNKKLNTKKLFILIILGMLIGAVFGGIVGQIIEYFTSN